MFGVWLGFFSKISALLKKNVKWKSSIVTMKIMIWKRNVIKFSYLFILRCFPRCFCFNEKPHIFIHVWPSLLGFRSNSKCSYNILYFATDFILVFLTSRTDIPMFVSSKGKAHSSASFDRHRQLDVYLKNKLLSKISAATACIRRWGRELTTWNRRLSCCLIHY